MPKGFKITNRTMQRVESLLGVFMALLLPGAMVAGPTLVNMAGSLLR